ncbi:hypothetical protein E2C01_081362 [Portunus trituberculatus]|uniref:Uncharacterized protein n=1 Tax=Portunus trituberculatus TaxID=210409 RepID=A0A5B7IM17_PORTR|nr:hypothetical protein [Portunus trituberculatus]
MPQVGSIMAADGKAARTCKAECGRRGDNTIARGHAASSTLTHGTRELIPPPLAALPSPLVTGIFGDAQGKGE